MGQEKTCAERVEAELADRLADIRKLWTMYRQDPDKYDDDLGNFNEYGLGFWYVPGGTEYNKGAGYFCWQLSTGGHGDEFRFYCDPDLRLDRVEYWFLDWFDGASLAVDDDTIREIWADWVELEVPQYAMKEANE